MFDENRSAFLLEVLKPGRLTQVVDIGANPLDPAPYSDLLAIGGCDVWGFEPQEAPFRKLQATSGPREHYLQYAVGSGTIGNLHLTKSSGFASTLEPNRQAFAFLGRWGDAARVVETVEFETRQLDAIEGLPDFDLLKIDIQGGECAVFENGKRKLAKALAVITEVSAIPLYLEQPLLDAQMISLSKQNYMLHKFLFFKSMKIRNKWTAALTQPNSNQLLDGDGVFIRHLLDITQLSDEQLKHLAILSDSVFLSYDIAITAIGRLVERSVVDASRVTQYAEMINRIK